MGFPLNEGRVGEGTLPELDKTTKEKQALNYLE